MASITYIIVNICGVHFMCVLGTGTNACYVEKLELVELWDGDNNSPRQVRAKWVRS